MILWIQGIYTLLTALWALIDIESFMVLTGPKTDVWLVKTVSIVLLAFSLGLITQIFIRSNPLLVIIPAMINSIGLAGIDFYYSSLGTISGIYRADGILEIVFAIIWLYLLIHLKKLKMDD